MKYDLLKILMYISKHTLIILVILCIGRPFLFAEKVAGQSIHEVFISLIAENISVDGALKNIETKTSFTFAYGDEVKEVSKRLHLNYSSKTVATILTDIAQETGIEFRQINNTISAKISRDYQPFSAGQPIKLISIFGVVTDQNDEPVSGVNVLVKGTTNGTITDVNGEYKLSVNEDDILIFSFIGLKSQEININNRSEINVRMENDISTLTEVTVLSTGYQTLAKERASGSFSYIGAETIESRPATDLTSAMEGLFTGLRVSEEDGLTVRGIGTIIASSEPLVVIDGFPVSDGFESINPNNVKSIHILKDAAAASIWGARASNGVIVITSKEPKEGLNISINAFTSIQNELDLSHYNPVASSSAALSWEQFLWENDHKFSSFSISEGVDGNNNPASLGITLLHQRDEGIITEQEFNQRWGQLQQTNYAKDVNKYLLQKPLQQNYDITIDGGSEKNRYILNTRYVDTKGNFADDHNTSLLANFRNDYQVAPWLSAHMGIMTKFNRSENSIASPADIRNISPYESIIEGDGSYSKMVGAHYQGFVDNVDGIFPRDWNYNILQETKENEFTTEQNDIRIQVGLDFDLLKGLTFEPKFQFEQFKGESKNYYSEDSYYVRDQLNKWVEYDQVNQEILQMYVPEGAQLNQSFNTTKSYTYRSHLKYDREFSNLHHVTAGLINEIATTEYETYSAPTIYGYNPDQLTSEVPNTYFPIQSYWGGTNYRLSGMESSLTYANNRFFSLAANLAYTYNLKYTLTGSYRVDASNLIVDDPSDRYSPFWSIGGNWQLGEESFMQNASFIDRLSLRLSHGFSGNVVPTSSMVPLITLYGTYPLTGAEYAAITDLGNPTLTWEKTKTTNFGIDYSLFGDKLFGSIEVYRKHGRDILGEVDLPRLTGTTTQVFNTAELVNKGFEVSLNAALPIGSNLSWGSNLNLSYNKSEVLSLQILDYSYSSLQNPHFEKGKPVDAIYSYHYLGMNEDNVPYLTGVDGETFTYNDVRPSTIDDREYMEYSGSAEPTTLLGWRNSFSAYGFSLSATVTGEFGHVFRRSTFDYSILFNNKASSTIHEDAESVIDGTATEIPTMPNADASNLNSWGVYSPYLHTLIEDAANVRVKEINLSYNLPVSLISKIGIKRAKVYVQIRDPKLIWTANDKGLDPRFIINGIHIIKPTTSYLFGLKLDF